MLIYLCLSSHGFGHAARQAAIFTQLYKIKPYWKYVVSSIVDYKFLNISFQDIPVIHRRVKWDIGTVQNNALSTDYESTLIELNEFEKGIKYIVNQEVEWIGKFRLPVLILGDIPPAATYLAQKLDVPLILMSNFGWDDIYEKFPSSFDEYTEKYKKQYCKAQYLLRFPFSLRMNWDIDEISVGLTFSNSKKLPEKILKEINSQTSPIVLVCFGGMGVEFDYKLYNIWPDFTFLDLTSFTFEEDKRNSDYPNNLIKISSSVRILDLLPYCSRIICKPGFSTFCEAISNKIGVHSVCREGFIETIPLTKGLQDYAYNRLLSKESFINGDWQLDKPLIPPLTKNLIHFNGASFSAYKIIQYINRNFN